MAYNKTAVAGGLIVGVIVVAGILRVKFHFDPPKDNFQEEIDFLLERQMALLANSVDDAPFAESVDTLSVTPTAASQPLYGEVETISLGTGIPLAVASEADGTSVVILRGNTLLLMQYDANWQLLPEGEHTLLTGIGLINGKAPIANLEKVTDGYRLLITQPTAAGTVVKVIAIDAQFAATTNNSLAVDPVVMTATADTLWSYNADAQLQIYSIAQGTLLAEQDNDLIPCKILVDDQKAIALSAQASGLIFSKVTAVGATESRVLVNSSAIVNCLTGARQQDHLGIVTPQAIELFNDNLTTSYPALPLPANVLFPQLGFSDQQLWLMYSSSETLGEYQLQVASYDLLAVVVLPDAATEYTN